MGRALDFGYDDFGHLDNDPDLESLRKLPGYRKLMRQHGIQSRVIGEVQPATVSAVAGGNREVD